MVRAAVCGTEGRQFESALVYQKMEKQNKLIPSLAKGFKDRWGKELALKKKLINTIEQVFINYGFQAKVPPRSQIWTLNPCPSSIRSWTV